MDFWALRDSFALSRKRNLSLSYPPLNSTPRDPMEMPGSPDPEQGFNSTQPNADQIDAISMKRNRARAELGPVSMRGNRRPSICLPSCGSTLGGPSHRAAPLGMYSAPGLTYIPSLSFTRFLSVCHLCTQF